MNVSPPSLLRRFLLGVSGQGFFRLALALSTIALVPAFIHAWGVAGYGQWIALTALATYLSYSNFGLITTSANEMIMAVGSGDTDRAQRCFQMSVNLVVFGVGPILLLLLALLSLCPLVRVFNLVELTNTQAMLVLTGLAIQFWMQNMRALYGAVLHAEHRYGFSYTVMGCTKILETVALVTALHSGATPVTSAFISALATGVDLIVTRSAAGRAALWARARLTLFDRDWLRRQARPAIGFATSNLASQGVLIQAPRMILGALLGGEAVALFAVYGTAMRLIDQLVLTIMLPMEIEIAHAAGADDRAQTRHLLRLATQLCWLAFAGIASGLMIFGPFIFHVWTRGQIVFNHSIMALYLVMAAGNQMGRVSAHALTSTNQLYGPAFMMLAAALLGLLLGSALAVYWNFIGMVVGVILGEILIALISVIRVGTWLGTPPLHLMIEAMDFRQLRRLAEAGPWNGRKYRRHI